MTLTPLDFKALLEEASRLNDNAEKLRNQARRIEDLVYRAAGVIYTDREAGFPCWTVLGSKRYYNTPQEAYTDNFWNGK